jgi:hypothetical protein
MVRKLWQMPDFCWKQLKLFITLLILIVTISLYQRPVIVDNLLFNNPTGLGYHDMYKIMSASQLDNCYTIYINMP